MRDSAATHSAARERASGTIVGLLVLVVHLPHRGPYVDIGRRARPPRGVRDRTVATRDLVSPGPVRGAVDGLSAC